MNALISIIIPTFNRSALIGRTIDSILAQSYRNWECLIIDDGSTDFTNELLEFYLSKDSRIKYYHRPRDYSKGANACRNFGMELSTGEYVKWFDSDDILAPDYLMIKIRAMLKTGAMACCCNARYFEEDMKQLINIFDNVSTSDGLLLDYITGKVNINSQVMLWKRDVISGTKFNENLHRAQELDFHFRLLKEKKVTVEFVNKELVFLRHHENSITGKYIKGNLPSIHSELLVRRNTLEFILSTDVERKSKKRTLGLYLVALRKLIYFENIFVLLGELRGLENIVKLKYGYFKWKLALLQLVLIYKVSHRDYRLKKHLEKLQIIIDFG